MKNVLIVTHRHGFEADPVIDGLRKLDIPVFRFNLDDGKSASRSTIILGPNDNGQVELFCDNRSIIGAEIGVGWCQQLWPYIGQVADQKVCLQRGNLLALQAGSFDLIPAPWLNHPAKVRPAAGKIWQLACARLVGLGIPETMVSNDPGDIRRFCSQFPTIAKNLATPWIVGEQSVKAAYTKRVRDEWLENDSALSFSPVIYQRFHKRKRDIRVVVIGDKIFAAECLPNTAQIEDVRLHGVTGKGFTSCDFDEKLTVQLLALMGMLSIEYCSADFIEDEAGGLYFLEANVCGAWWWVDRLYGGAICQAIVDYLHSRLVNE